MDGKPVRGWSLGAGRRERSADGRRPKVVKLRLSDEELLELQLAAANHGVSVQRYLMECEAVARAGGGETVTQRRESLSELVAMRRLLANLANNMNQIAAAANSGAEVREQAKGAIAAARRTTEKMYELIKALLPR